MNHQNQAKSDKKIYNQQKVFQNYQRAQNCNKHNPSGNFLADRNEFPSLSEISEPDKSQPKNPSYFVKAPLTYSDKLKVSFPKQKHHINNAKLTDYGNNSNHQYVNVQRQLLNPARNQSDKTTSDNLIRTFPASRIEEKIKNKINNSSAENVKFDPSHLRLSRVSDDITGKKREGVNNAASSNKMPKVKEKPKNEMPKNGIQNKGSGEECGNEQLSKTKKKKKRKSKVKRQVGLQSGKIIVLTPEAHSKILNQSLAQSSQVPKRIVTDINDSEEYPELGKACVSKSIEKKVSEIVVIDLKGNGLSESCENKEKDDKSTNCLNSLETSSFVSNQFIQETIQNSIVNEKSQKNDKEIKSETKSTVHKKDPITVSFIDMLSTTKVKTKEPKEKLESRIIQIPDKIKKAQPHNLLDSNPAIKRGKERENPRAKRPSHLKKIILLDRQMRKEKLSQCLNHTLENKKAENGNTFEVIENGITDLNSTVLANIQSCESSVLESTNETFSLSFESFEAEKGNKYAISSNGMEVEENVLIDSKTISTCNDDTCFYGTEVNDKREFDEEIYDENDELHMPEVSDHYPLDVISLSDSNSFKSYAASENIIEDESINKSKISEQLHETVRGTSENKSCIELSLSDKFEKLDIRYNTDYMLVQSITNSPNFIHLSEKEKLEAAKIVIHTRNFREYCNHLTSKDIDDAVTALLDDLVRFQDRMHQKDPVKAKMKRRLIYGIKEVKKHLNLRKLKCIIIATDIENVQAEGGLNDVLNEIKSSAEDHHIPCIFSLTRKRLGKLCHKPVPVSCLGVFNYDGSEANFKKMIELQKQSTKDYMEILNNLVETLSDDSVGQLVKVRNEAPETLHNLRTDILRKFLLPDRKQNENAEFVNFETA